MSLDGKIHGRTSEGELEVLKERSDAATHKIFNELRADPCFAISVSPTSAFFASFSTLSPVVGLSVCPLTGR